MSVKFGSSQPLATPPAAKREPQAAAANAVAPTPERTELEALREQPRSDSFEPATRAAAAAPHARASRTYVVQSGDTLGKIARRFATSVDRIVEDNALAHPDRISVGQKLRIGQGVVLEVEQGDSLKSLAAQYGLTVEGLASPNGLTAGAKLAAGQQLSLPGGTVYKVKAGDTLGQIAKRFGTTAKAIGKANGLKDLNQIAVGQQLVFVRGEGARPVPPKPDPLKDPALMKEHRGHEKYHLDRGAKLYVDGVGADDVIQGQAGDCYLLCALSAFAGERPEVIEKAITANDDGSYTVRFFEYHWDEVSGPGYRPVKVRIDGDLPGDRDYRLYAEEGRSGKELWAPLIEKAYAKWKGGYEEIGNGGWPGEALSALTGTSYTSLYPGSEKNWLAQLEKNLRKDAVVTAYTHDTKKVAGVIDGHAYSVHGIVVKDGKKFIQLRNPWGSTEYGRDGKDDGTFLIPPEQFRKAFSGIELVA